jgi:hypothetical protein
MGWDGRGAAAACWAKGNNLFKNQHQSCTSQEIQWRSIPMHLGQIFRRDQNLGSTFGDQFVGTPGLTCDVFGEIFRPFPSKLCFSWRQLR